MQPSFNSGSVSASFYDVPDEKVNVHELKEAIV